MRRARRWLAAVLAAATAACGGGGDDDDGLVLLPLLAQDELVALLPADSAVGRFVVCSSGATIYAAWAERTTTAVDPIFFSRSLDHGRTWLRDPVRLDDPLAGSAGDVTMCCDGSRVYVAYVKFDGGGSTVRLNRSLDAGETFLAADVRVSGLAARDVSDPVLFCHGLDVHAAWLDSTAAAGTMNLIREVRYSRSTDGGASFPTTDVPLNSDPPGTGFATQLSLCGDATHVYAVWSQVRGGVVTLRANRSTDAGVTFLPADVAVSHGGSIQDVGTPPALACDGDFLAVAWGDGRSGTQSEVFFNRSVDAGLTFQPVDLPLRTTRPGSRDAFGPVLCRDGDVLHVLWIDERTRAAELRYVRSRDLGQTFTDDVAITSAEREGLHVSGPSVVCRGDRLVVGWDDDRAAGGLTSNGFVAVSEDGGATFTESPVATAPPGSASGQVRPCLEGDELTVLFADDRGGRSQVRVNRTR